MNKYVFSVFNRSGDVVWEETRSSYEKCIEFLVLNDVLDDWRNIYGVTEIQHLYDNIWEKL